jgi:hypothetical protein
MTVSPRSGARYAAPIRELLRRAALLNGQTWYISSALNKRALEVTSWLTEAEARGVARHYVAGSNFLAGDVMEPSRELMHGGSYILQRQQMVHALVEAQNVYAAWAVAQGFEAFETFVQDVAAAYLSDNSSALSEKQWATSRGGVTYPRGKRARDMRPFVRSAYRGVEDVLKALRITLPQLVKVEKQNNRTVNLDDWFRVLALVRHATVHSRGLIPADRIDRLPASSTKLLDDVGGKRTRSGGYELHLRLEHAELAIRMLAEYGYAIYKACCNASSRQVLAIHQLRTKPKLRAAKSRRM